MTDYDLTPEELQTLARFTGPKEPLDIDPHHFAKLLSLALIEQKEGGSELTTSGLARIKQSHSASNDR